jgi:hypothetical protein
MLMRALSARNAMQAAHSCVPCGGGAEVGGTWPQPPNVVFPKRQIDVLDDDRQAIDAIFGEVLALPSR